ncbi:hypothetical protein M427DRAFT_45885 [Gonapodya prolifera JEL478]|uniref:DNA-directed RNA polymerase n=1 Tax=Gonapodya prolifera (strain JEL478) TaxID=1344416 RepID=A0A139A9I1_GONPJ|nr:hypothetical protein M427DRAFT_45885 [Gonapodya prolifera JEL478]|eukprot:KXS13125.1 hypothetical protein M427DRAFT_45885 [Gonapodya prolifera JEL478]
MSYYNSYSSFDAPTYWQKSVEFLKHPYVWGSLLALIAVLIIMHVLGSFDKKVSTFAPEALYSWVLFATKTADSEPLLDLTSTHKMSGVNFQSFFRKIRGKIRKLSVVHSDMSWFSHSHSQCANIEGNIELNKKPENSLDAYQDNTTAGELELLKEIIATLSSSIKLQGIPAITKTHIVEDNQFIFDQSSADFQKKTGYAIETEGIDLAKTMAIDDILYQEVICDNPLQAERVLGIEVARKTIINELKKVAKVGAGAGEIIVDKGGFTKQPPIPEGVYHNFEIESQEHHHHIDYIPEMSKQTDQDVEECVKPQISLNNFRGLGQMIPNDCNCMCN